MSKLVKNLLDLSRLEQMGTITSSPVDLRELLTQILDEYAELVKGGTIFVTNDGENRIKALLSLPTQQPA